jgi:lipid-binding SYLF domain-containing protein
MRHLQGVGLAAAVAFACALFGCTTDSSELRFAKRDTKSEIDQNARQALSELYAAMPLSSALAPKAKAILVFPRICKAGFMIGGQYGNGVGIRPDGTSAGYFNLSSASYGLQAGAQGYSYALFFMSDAAIEHVKKTGGWEVGVGPSVVLVDEGVAKTLTTTTAKDDVYAFIYGHKGLMAGIGIHGSKITRINPAP